jgi:hypothetical protein
MKPEAGPSLCNRLSQPPLTLESRSLWLLGRCSRQLCKSCAGADMVYSQVECVFILRHYFALKLFAAACEKFRSAE